MLSYGCTRCTCTFTFTVTFTFTFTFTFTCICTCTCTCTRLEIGVQSVYEDVARDTNRYFFGTWCHVPDML